MIVFVFLFWYCMIFIDNWYNFMKNLMCLRYIEWIGNEGFKFFNCFINGVNFMRWWCFLDLMWIGLMGRICSNGVEKCIIVLLGLYRLNGVGVVKVVINFCLGWWVFIVFMIWEIWCDVLLDRLFLSIVLMYMVIFWFIIVYFIVCEWDIWF